MSASILESQCLGCDHGSATSVEGGFNLLIVTTVYMSQTICLDLPIYIYVFILKRSQVNFTRKVAWIENSFSFSNFELGEML